MIPKRIEGANIKLVGEGCLDLHAIKADCPTFGTSFTTAWELSTAEMAALQSGEPILLTVFGSQFPPVWLGVRNAT